MIGAGEFRLDAGAQHGVVCQKRDFCPIITPESEIMIPTDFRSKSIRFAPHLPLVYENSTRRHGQIAMVGTR